MPRFEMAAISEYFIPYWPLAVFWTFYWPFWIRRGEHDSGKKVKLNSDHAREASQDAL